MKGGENHMIIDLEKEGLATRYIETGCKTIPVDSFEEAEGIINKKYSHLPEFIDWKVRFSDMMLFVYFKD